jgi:hypothetical protein
MASSSRGGCSRHRSTEAVRRLIKPIRIPLRLYQADARIVFNGDGPDTHMNLIAKLESGTLSMVTLWQHSRHLSADGRLPG